MITAEDIIEKLNKALSANEDGDDLTVELTLLDLIEQLENI